MHVLSLTRSDDTKDASIAFPCGWCSIKQSSFMLNSLLCVCKHNNRHSASAMLLASFCFCAFKSLLDMRSLRFEKLMFLQPQSVGSDSVAILQSLLPPVLIKIKCGIAIVSTRINVTSVTSFSSLSDDRPLNNHIHPKWKQDFVPLTIDDYVDSESPLLENTSMGMLVLPVFDIPPRICCVLWKKSNAVKMCFRQEICWDWVLVRDGWRLPWLSNTLSFSTLAPYYLHCTTMSHSEMKSHRVIIFVSEAQGASKDHRLSHPSASRSVNGFLCFSRAPNYNDFWFP